MSFGLLKHFKDLKKSGQARPLAVHLQHIIIGHDLGAILKLIELKHKFPTDSIKLISNRPLNKQSLIEANQFGVTQIRSEVAVTEIFKKHFNVNFQPQTKEASFYKDGKFHEFGHRAKSMDLLIGEEFFMKKGYRLNIASLFGEDWANLDETLKQHQEIRIFESIEKTIPSDLVEKQEWLLTFKDFSKISCENLYLSQSPKKFLSLFAHKEKCTAELIDVCTSVKVKSAISVTWILNNEVSSEERTLYIPQSMTHEWGHFIVDFEAFDHGLNQQLCHGLFIIHDEDPQAEDLGSKIKLMKRVLDRVFPALENSIIKEFIRFDEDMFISGVKDEAIEQLSFDYPSLKFIGQLSPMKSNLTSEKYLARTLLN